MLTLILLLAIPYMACADGMATSVCVMDKVQFDKLVQSTGNVAKVDIRVLWSSSLTTGMSKAPDKVVKLEFACQGKQFRLHVTELENKTLYAILNVTEKTNERLVASGEIPKGREVKETVDGEPFVVVVRTGNFLKK